MPSASEKGRLGEAMKIATLSQKSFAARRAVKYLINQRIYVTMQQQNCATGSWISAWEWHDRIRSLHSLRVMRKPRSVIVRKLTKAV